MSASIFDSLIGMKKVDSAQRHQELHQPAKGLKPRTTKGGRRRIRTPDFLSYLTPLRYSEQVGDQVLQEFNDSLS